MGFGEYEQVYTFDRVEGRGLGLRGGCYICLLLCLVCRVVILGA